MPETASQTDTPAYRLARAAYDTGQTGLSPGYTVLLYRLHRLIVWLHRCTIPAKPAYRLAIPFYDTGYTGLSSGHTGLSFGYTSRGFPAIAMASVVQAPRRRAFVTSKRAGLCRRETHFPCSYQGPAIFISQSAGFYALSVSVRTTCRFPPDLYVNLHAQIRHRQPVLLTTREKHVR